MADETKLSFSHEHPGSTTGEPEIDTYRSQSDRPGVEKVEHSPVNPGYGDTPVDIPVNNSSDKK